MATPGVKLNIPKSTIVTVLKEAKGVMTTAAKALKVAPHTLRLKIKEDKELVEILANLRHNFEESMLDMAENTLLYAISKREDDMNNALKSSFYILNNKGKERGYNRDNYQQNDESGKHFGALMSQLAGMQKKAQELDESDTLKSDEIT